MDAIHQAGLPTCPECRIALMWPTGTVWQCESCGLVTSLPSNDESPRHASSSEEA